MTFEREGFFSSQAEAFRLHTREMQPFKAWFDYALGLNRLGYEMLPRLTSPDKSAPALNTTFVRVHKSFQSVLILAERGLVPDARAVLRSAVEHTIAIQALAEDVSFFEQMIGAHHLAERVLARKSHELAALLSADTLARTNKAITDADAYEASTGRKLKGIRWEEVAKRYYPTHLYRLLYDVFYRDLSSDGTHATINSLDRLLGVEGDDQFTAIKAGPHTNGLVDLLRHASLIFLLAAEVCAKMNALGDVTAALDRAVKEFHALDGADPTPAVATSPPLRTT